MKLAIKAIGGNYLFSNINNFRIAKHELRWNGPQGKSGMALPFIHSWKLDSEGDPVDKHNVHLDPAPDGTRWHCTCGDYGAPVLEAAARTFGMAHADRNHGTYTEEEIKEGE